MVFAAAGSTEEAEVYDQVVQGPLWEALEKLFSPAFGPWRLFLSSKSMLGLASRQLIPDFLFLSLWERWCITCPFSWVIQFSLVRKVGHGGISPCERRVLAGGCSATLWEACSKNRWRAEVNTWRSFPSCFCTNPVVNLSENTAGCSVAKRQAVGL